MSRPVVALVSAVVAGALGVAAGFALGSTGDDGVAPNPYEQPPVSGMFAEDPNLPGTVWDSWGITCPKAMLTRVEPGLYACDFTTPTE